MKCSAPDRKNCPCIRPNSGMVYADHSRCMFCNRSFTDMAYQLGRESFGERDAENPWDFDGTTDDQALAEAWSDGRGDAELEAGEEFADYCDSSMRDCYE